MKSGGVRWELPDRIRVLPFTLKSKRGRRRGGVKVAYEFNGICALSASDGAVAGARLAAAGGVRRPAPPSGDEEGRGKGRMEERRVGLLLLFGRAGAEFEYRRSFAEPILMRAAKAVVKFKVKRLVWRKDARVLEIAGEFPRSPEVVEVSSGKGAASRLKRRTSTTRSEAGASEEEGVGADVPEDGGQNSGKGGDAPAFRPFLDVVPADVASRLKASERRFLKKRGNSMLAVRLEWVE